MKASPLNPVGCRKMTEEEVKRCLILTDPDVLLCPICFDNLKIPVYQCENGHIACGLCCSKMNHKCPTCSLLIRHIRCRAIENVLDVVYTPCQNIKYGCEYKMKYSENFALHEASCVYLPCSCPMDDCNIVDSAGNLYEHFFYEHHSATAFSFNCRFNVMFHKNTTRIFLQERTTDCVFVLSNIIVEGTRMLSIVVIAPKSDQNKYFYELEAKDNQTRTTLTLQSRVEALPKFGDDYKPTRFLGVNSISHLISAYLELGICIRSQER